MGIGREREAPDQPAPTTESDEAAPESAETETDRSDLDIDSDDEQVAEAEIAEALGRISQDNDKASSRRSGSGPGRPGASTGMIPAPLRLLVALLTLVDYAFGWMPPGAKDFLGYLGISLLILGMILWTLVLFR